ncbi:tetratricopeptide repeat protein 28-like isoform X2 [Saccostrea echinata]|uniref:tetratricopeptide repeat protein 28-like isoform X2 n=1 Tax=Saccostrea echinata TaxID=191078 RepID=UPI002A7F405F|nr:tetratricopeptide repeat protein 28-like isoform X2 [Saccostrea echinata]
MTERPSHFSSQGLSHSFSMASLAEGSSEPISEAEEINEMKSLTEMGNKAMQIRDFNEAIKHYDEALEIDDKNVEVLNARILAFIEMKDYKRAHKDAEYWISLDSDSAKAFRFLGITLHELDRPGEALNAFLTALDLDPQSADELTTSIATVSTFFCEIPPDVLRKIKGMDPYKKLSEVGVCLFQSKKYELTIKILEAAQKFETNQKGITMRVLLTMANSFSALRKNEQAINLYQECLSTAMATHEQIYQTKSLVNIATLYLEIKDTHQAIVYYEKLLDLEAEIREEAGSEENFPDFWTKELQCGLHLNLSIAYKSIGNMAYAEKHARKYVKLLEKFGIEGRAQSESYHNTGMLNEILGNFNEALKNYSLYLRVCKKNGDKKGMAQAYGCLGSVYAAIRNWKLAITYHEQHIAMAKRFNDPKMLVIAYEMMADTYMVKEDFDKAVENYNQMLNSCIRTDYRAKSMAFCKLGNAYRDMKKTQYAIGFYEQASNLAEDFDYVDILTMCHYNLACIKRHSKQMMEIEEARKYFEKLIPLFETKIREHRDEDTYCPSEYHTQLQESYDGIQNVLCKMGNKEECLQYAEAYRKRYITQIKGHPVSYINYGPQTDFWAVDRMSRLVNEQNAAVVYYSVLSHRVLSWVFVPGSGLVRFYSGKSADVEDMQDRIQICLDGLKNTPDWKTMQNSCEDRCLPIRNAQLQYTRRKNLALGKDVIQDKTNKDLSEEGSPNKILFNLLLAPVEDILMKLPQKSHLIIIPDKNLYDCPFGILQDWNARYLCDRFHLTLLPSLFALEKVINNEMNYMKAQDDLDFERSQTRNGGMNRVLAQMVMTNAISPDMEKEDTHDSYDLRKTANPRLLTTMLGMPASAGSNKGEMTSKVPMPSSQESSRGAFSPRKPLPGIVTHNTSNKYQSQIGSPLPMEKMLNAHTYTILTKRTSTGTDITSSTMCITSYQQICDTDKCVVFGNPRLPEKLLVFDCEWKPANVYLPAAKRELSAVASYLNVDPITGPDATKENFISSIENATVIHIASYGCWKEGFIVFTPGEVKLHEGPPQESSYLLSLEDIIQLKLKAQIVVLNIGYGPNRYKECIPPGFTLPSAFLNAGAQCVLVSMWSLPNIAMEKFYYHFYTTLNKGALVTDALGAGIKGLRADERFNDPFFWSPWILIGKDVKVNLLQIQHSMLDQALNKTEKELEEEKGKELLNPKNVLPLVSSREDNLKTLQECLAFLLLHHKGQPEVIPKLIDLLDSALKRLHTEENNRQTTRLPDCVIQSSKAMELLRLLGFHFQAKGASLSSPYVVYPHWNQDELLIPTYDALRAITDISFEVDCVQAIHDMLPLTQDSISLLVDLLAITKHAAEVQLKVSDLSVRPLWQNSRVKKVLTATGFHQIGLLLNFNKTPSRKQLLTAVLQFMLSVSAYKSQVLLYRLDVNLLGKSSASKKADSVEMSKLPSLTPVILPRNQLRMSTPWLSKPEKPEEMEEKIKLARSKSDVDDEFRDHLERAKTWHQISVIAQANERLAQYGRPRTTPTKVKVLPGASSSQQRTPVNKERLLVIPEVDQRRDYAGFVLQQRMDNIDVRHKTEVMKLYLPYIQTTPSS